MDRNAGPASPGTMARHQPEYATITVVIGNPPYKEKAMGQGGWIEQENENEKAPAPLSDWMPPSEWGVGAHAKHLRNLYVYFWRWATWKAFDHGPGDRTGIVCFITVAGFLNGPGFQRMRDYLRRTCDDIWIVDCSPEGHQPEVNTRIFQGVQQPVCIVLASRSATNKKAADAPASVLFRTLPKGHRDEKLKALLGIRLKSSSWVKCPEDWRAPFLPENRGAWSAFPMLDDLFVYNGSGVQPKRTWVIAPDAGSLVRRWNALISAPAEKKEFLFHATLRDGKPADRHIRSIVREPIPGYSANLSRLVDESAACLPPVRYAFRSFNRQWIIPDARVITQPNAELWRSRSDLQIYLTALSRSAPSGGPSVTFNAFVPDLDCYSGRGGRVFPLWGDSSAEVPNVRPNLLMHLCERLNSKVAPEDLMAYIGGIAGHPAFTARFRSDLATPGIRIPITADANLFWEVVRVGRRVIWAQTFGDRMADAADGRPAGPPRLPKLTAPFISVSGAISAAPEDAPSTVHYDSSKRRLLIGSGFIENVEPAVWNYEVSGRQVITQWFSYRKSDRQRPLIGDRRPPSPLGDIQPDHWLPEYTSELISLLNVLGLLVEIEAEQEALLERVCAGAMISLADLGSVGAMDLPVSNKTKDMNAVMGDLFES